MSKYAKLGVKYYVIYNREYNRRDRHEPLEIYQLVDGHYQRQLEELFWILEIALELGECKENWGELVVNG